MTVHLKMQLVLDIHPRGWWLEQLKTAMEVNLPVAEHKYWITGTRQNVDTRWTFGETMNMTTEMVPGYTKEGTHSFGLEY